MTHLRVFTAFSGYDSQCLALNRLGLPYELVGWSEIDKYAIQAHNALFPQWSERNYGDISKIEWSAVPAGLIEPLLYEGSFSMWISFEGEHKDYRIVTAEDLWEANEALNRHLNNYNRLRYGIFR